MNDVKTKTDEYWKKKLSDDEYAVLREAKTESPFTGELLHEKRKGVFKCKACGEVVFDSNTKYDSGSGWPSFYDVAEAGKVNLKEDNSHEMRRIEVTCSNCGSHLGHVFDDGPLEMNGEKCTGKRYCINSISLDFDEEK